MHIESVAVSNYKSFLDRQELKFEPGFNLLIGTNNAGKTTILDVIDMDIGSNDPHRSELTIANHGDQSHQTSKLEVVLATHFSELQKLVGGAQVFLPLRELASPTFTEEKLIGQVKAFVAKNHKLRIHSVFGSGTEALGIVGDDLIVGTRNRQEAQIAMAAAAIQFLPGDTQPQIVIGNYGGHGPNVLSYGQAYRSRIYRFNAQRRPGHACGAQGAAVLDREASTLPYCLNHLQTNDATGHRMFCEWVNRVFPSVKWVQATPNGGNFEIRCLPNRPEIRRDDLAISLARMGAGIGNVLAMFYVVLTSREPQVIAIDEPNAFLHPRALREMLVILEAEGRQHQFILTAHSADVLTAVNTQTISLLDFDGIKTTVKQVNKKEFHVLRGGLADLGIRVTDLHAKDRVFWVEGQSEELTMPQLLRWACPEIAAGTSVLRVERTGSFSKKGWDPIELVGIYERLATSSALVPPMVCILLDREGRKSEECAKIEQASNGKLRFLEQKMLENYLLHAKAIASVLSDLGQVTTEEVIAALLSANKPGGVRDGTDGAAILQHVFGEISGAKQEFRKTRDVPALVTWLLENDSAHLQPLKVFLRACFSLGERLSLSSEPLVPQSASVISSAALR